MILLTLPLLAACMVNPAAQVASGNEAYYAGDYGAAFAAYEPVMVAQPAAPLFHYNGGLALAGLDRLADAEIALRQTLNHADTIEIRADAYYNLGNIYFIGGRYAEAVEAYQNALMLRPGDPDTQYNLELALMQLGQATPPDEPPQQQETDVTPTPSASPTQPAQPDGADGATPTPEPGADGPPTATPTQPGDAGGGQPDESDPPPNESESGAASGGENPDDMSEADALRLLDALGASQETLDLSLEPEPLPGAGDNDW